VDGTSRSEPPPIATTGRHVQDLRTTTFLTAVASLGAGGIHLAASGPHLAESVPLGVSFLVVGWLQVLLAAAFWRRPTWLGAVGLAALHIAALAAWAVSRTVGLPFGHVGPEPLGVGGLTAVGLQVVGLAAVAWFLREPARVRPLPFVAALGAAAVVLGGASVAVVDVGAGHGHETGSGTSGSQGSDDHASDETDRADGDGGVTDDAATSTTGPAEPSGPAGTPADDGHGHDHERDGAHAHDD
jgi:hypothetical protein